MISNLDIYRTANVLIREHGAGAALEAAQRAEAMLGLGDVAGRCYPRERSPNKEWKTFG